MSAAMKIHEFYGDIQDPVIFIVPGKWIGGTVRGRGRREPPIGQTGPSIIIRRPQ